MQNVFVDTNGGGLWRYDPVSKRYSRLEESGKISAVIEGCFIPDPEELWKKRCEMYSVARNSHMGQKLRPQPATFALWNHWQETRNADRNN